MTVREVMRIDCGVWEDFEYRFESSPVWRLWGGMVRLQACQAHVRLVSLLVGMADPACRLLLFLPSNPLLVSEAYQVHYCTLYLSEDPTWQKVIIAIRGLK